MLCLEVWKEKRVEGKGGKQSRGEGNDYPFPLFDVLKFKQGGGE